MGSMVSKKSVSSWYYQRNGSTEVQSTNVVVTGSMSDGICLCDKAQNFAMQ